MKSSMRCAAMLLLLARILNADTNGPAHTLVVTARGIPVRLAETPGSVGIIDATDLSAWHPVSLSDVASMKIPGVYSESDTPWGGEFNIRGFSRDSVVLLIDGVRLNTATDIAGRYGLIAASDVRRIEVLKGPISSMYGSGSLGGVVNVITERGCFSERAEWYSGIRGMYRENPAGPDFMGFVTRSTPRSYVYLSQCYRRHGDYQDGMGETVADTQFEDWQSKMNAGYRISPACTVAAELQYCAGNEIGIPGSGGAPLPPAARITYPSMNRTLMGVDVNVTPSGDLLEESRVHVYHQGVARRVRIDRLPDSSPFLVVRPRAQHDTMGLKWVNTLTPAQQQVTAGLDVWQRQLDSARTKTDQRLRVIRETPIPESSFLSAGGFLEDDWQVKPGLTVNAGGRLDYIGVDNRATDRWVASERDETEWSMQGGGTIACTPWCTMKGIAASGYRAASLEERYQYLDLGNNQVKLGDPELDPERSLLLEAGVTFFSEGAHAGVTVFRNSVRDMIGERRISSNTLVNANVDRARIQGIEAQAGWRFLENLEFYGNVAALDGEDQRTGEPLPSVAPVSGTVGLRTGRTGQKWAAVECRLVDRQDDVPAGATETAGYGLVNVSAGWSFEAGHIRQELSCGVDNLLDRDYREFLASFRGTPYHEPGRSFYAGYGILF